MIPAANVLIAEDSMTQALTLKNSLENEGYSVALAKDGVEAVDYLKNDDFLLPDLIISDIIMPNMDGYQLCSEVKKSFDKIFIIMLTGSGDEEALKKSFQSGAMDFLEKPFNQTELLLRVKNVLRIKRAENLLKKTMDQLAENNKMLKKLSTTDELTGLANRRHLINSLKEKIYDAGRYSTPLSIILFDIDFFKNINDNYGHLVGDDVLKKISSVFLKNKRISDIIGRYGGEEFLLILPNTLQQDAVNVAENLRKQIKNLVFESVDRPITISGGVCAYNKEVKYEHFLSKVDDLLYTAKDNGRNRIEC